MKQSPELAPVRELLSLLSASSGVQVWRGQADARWPLQPGLYRRIRTFSNSPQAVELDEATCKAYETDILCESNGMRHYTENRAKTMVMLQHHGGATRLLDVTRSQFVALWFASAEIPGGADGVVYHLAVRPEREYHYYDADSWDSIVDARHTGRPVLYFPHPFDERIKAQQSGFLTTVLSSTCGPEQDFVQPSDDIEIHKVVVPAEAKPALRRYLDESHGVNGYSVYPDFAGYALANSAGSPFPRQFSELNHGRDGIFPNRKL